MFPATARVTAKTRSLTKKSMILEIGVSSGSSDTNVKETCCERRWRLQGSAELVWAFPYLGRFENARSSRPEPGPLPMERSTLYRMPNMTRKCKKATAAGAQATPARAQHKEPENPEGTVVTAAGAQTSPSAERSSESSLTEY